MKKISIIMTAVGMLFFHSCTKEKLVTINEPLELDENSRQYQQYMVERAINFIQLYRFDKLGDLMDRIKDPLTKAKVEALYAEYLDRAENKALYFITPQNERLYFLPSVPNDATQFNVNFEPLFWDMQNQRNIINSEGVLHGFKNYPNVTNFGISNCLATGLEDLEAMPEMTTFGWSMQTDIMIERYPDRELAPTKLQADLSQNHKLEIIQMDYIDIADMKFPGHKLSQWFYINNGVIDNNLSTISTNDMRIRTSIVTETEIVLSNSVNRLELTGISGLKKLNLKNLKDLELIFLDLRDCEELTLPDGITNEILTDSRSIAYWAEPLRLKQGCIIHDAPAGIEAHVRYY